MSQAHAGTIIRAGELPPTATPLRNEPEVDIGRRRALVQAGWIVPTILAAGLVPRKAKAIDPYGTDPDTELGPFDSPGEAERALFECLDRGHNCFTVTRTVEVDGDIVTRFFVLDP